MFRLSRYILGRCYDWARQMFVETVCPDAALEQL